MCEYDWEVTVGHVEALCSVALSTRSGLARIGMIARDRRPAGVWAPRPHSRPPEVTASVDCNGLVSTRRPLGTVTRGLHGQPEHRVWCTRPWRQHVHAAASRVSDSSRRERLLVQRQLPNASPLPARSLCGCRAANWANGSAAGSPRQNVGDDAPRVPGDDDNSHEHCLSSSPRRPTSSTTSTTAGDHDHHDRSGVDLDDGAVQVAAWTRLQYATADCGGGAAQLPRTVGPTAPLAAGASRSWRSVPRSCGGTATVAEAV